MTAAWFASQPREVRAVLELAALRDECRVWGEQGTDERHDLILDALCPAHADTIRAIADHLYWIDRLTNETPRDVLSAYQGEPAQVRFYNADQVADELVARLRTDAVSKSQMVAALLRVGVTS